MNNTCDKTYKLGILGGSFDPIHYGHLIAAESAREGLALENVLFIPAGKSPHKQFQVYASRIERYRMTELAIASNTLFQLSDIEIKRDGPSYTIDTIRVLLDLYPGAQIYFITGADAILEVATWKNAEELLSLCCFVAVSRPGYCLNEVWKAAGTFINNPEKRIHGLVIPAIDISSTEIRKRVREGKTVRYMLPDKVIDFISEHGLYRFNRLEKS